VAGDLSSHGLSSISLGSVVKMSNSSTAGPDKPISTLADAHLANEG